MNSAIFLGRRLGFWCGVGGGRGRIGFFLPPPYFNKNKGAAFFLCLTIFSYGWPYSMAPYFNASREMVTSTSLSMTPMV